MYKFSTEFCFLNVHGGSWIGTDYGCDVLSYPDGSFIDVSSTVMGFRIVRRAGT